VVRSLHVQLRLYRLARDRKRSGRLPDCGSRLAGTDARRDQAGSSLGDRDCRHADAHSLDGEADRNGLIAMQREYRIRPLSEYIGEKPPKPAPSYLFPAWDEARANSIDFISYLNFILSYLNFILRFAPTVASEQEIMQRFAMIGIGAGRPFDAIRLDPSLRKAIGGSPIRRLCGRRRRQAAGRCQDLRPAFRQESSLSGEILLVDDDV
jgi:hypothetical protein